MRASELTACCILIRLEANELKEKIKFSDKSNRSKSSNKFCMSQKFSNFLKSRQDVEKFSVVVSSQVGRLFNSTAFSCGEQHVDVDESALFGVQWNESGKHWHENCLCACFFTFADWNWSGKNFYSRLDCF